MTPCQRSRRIADFRTWPRIVVGSALLAMLALAGCNRNETEGVGTRLDVAVDKTADKTSAAGARVEESAGTAKEAIGKAVDSTSQAVNDTGITAAIKAKLAADDGLQALNISVETTAGRAVLEGTAPDAVSRDRATQVAAAVEGVVAVDNRLMIKD